MKDLNCYISVPLGVNTDGLRRVLADLDVRVSSLDELSPAGSNFLSVIEKEMRDADFVCVVLDRKVENPNVLFELGLAVGLSRPILIVAEDRFALPAVLISFPVVQASADNVDALSFHLKIFLQNFKQSAKAAKVAPLHRWRRAPTTGRVGQLFFRDGRSQGVSSEGQKFEELILSALREKGLEAIGNPEFKNTGDVARPDVVAWFPEAPPGLAIE